MDQYSTCLSIATSFRVPRGCEEVKGLGYSFALVWPGHADAPMSDLLTRLECRRRIDPRQISLESGYEERSEIRIYVLYKLNTEYY